MKECNCRRVHSRRRPLSVREWREGDAACLLLESREAFRARILAVDEERKEVRACPAGFSIYISPSPLFLSIPLSRFSLLFFFFRILFLFLLVIIIIIVIIIEIIISSSNK